MTVTFYTCRHIFAEEVRRAQTYTRFELAAMMGHSLLTNQAFYGPRDATMPRGSTSHCRGHGQAMLRIFSGGTIR